MATRLTSPPLLRKARGEHTRAYTWMHTHIHIHRSSLLSSCQSSSLLAFISSPSPPLLLRLSSLLFFRRVFCLLIRSVPPSCSPHRGAHAGTPFDRSALLARSGNRSHIFHHVSMLLFPLWHLRTDLSGDIRPNLWPGRYNPLYWKSVHDWSRNEL